MKRQTEFWYQKFYVKKYVKKFLLEKFIDLYRIFNKLFPEDDS